MLRLEVRKLCCGKVFWKCPYLSDLEPAFKATNGMMFLWSAIDNSWYLCDETGKPHGSCNAQLLRWGYEKLNLPSGKVLVPANCSNGDPKFQVLSTHEMEQWVKKQKKPVSFKVAARAAATAKSKAKVPEPALPPRPSSKVIKACKLKPRGSVAYGSSSGSAMTPYGTFKPPEPPMPPPGHTPEPAEPAVRPRQGWMMKTKELVVAYNRAEWGKFEALCAE